MKFILHDLKVDFPVHISGVYDPKELDMEFVDLKYNKGILLDGTAEKGEETLHFRGHLKSEVEHLCGRCLKTVSDKVDYPFDLYYDIKGKTEIDTLPDLRELVILDHPISYVCSPDCKGLCPNCGINLNEANCNCDRQSQSGALAALKNVRIKRKEEK